MKEHYSDLKKLIKGCDLSEEKKLVLNTFFASAKDEELMDVINLLENDPTAIAMIYKNIEDKWNAGQDQSQWEDVLKKEEELLKSIN